MTIFYIVLPIFLIIGAGFLFRKNSIANNSWVHILNQFVYYVSLPAIILVSFWEIDWANKDLWQMVGFNSLAIFLFSVILLFVLSLFKISNKAKASIYLVSIVGNTVYMGFPIVGGVVAKENFGTAIGVAATHLVLGLLFGILVSEFLVVKSKKIKVYILDFIKNPLIISLVLGIILSFLKLEGGLADIAEKTMAMLGATASPVALFALGGFLHGKFKKQDIGCAVSATIIKLAIFPLMVLLFAKGLNLSLSGQSVSVLVSTMPAAVTGFVIAEKYNLDKQIVANAIVLSTAVSVVTISLFLFKML